jgi:hypothetical protein
MASQDEQPTAASSAAAPGESGLPQVERPTGRVPVYDFEFDHKRRYHAAVVKERETHAEQADEDRELRKRIANHVSIAIAAQVGVADGAFLIYGFWNGWNIPGSTMIAWLSSTVVQVIAVGLVVTKSLFPSTPARPTA